MADFSRVTYDKFTKAKWYREVNRHLVMISGMGSGARVLDLGAGTGSSTELILDQIDGHGEIIVLDHKRDYLNIAKRKFSKHPNVRFIEADAIHVDEFIHGGHLEGVFIFNAVHLIEDYRTLFKVLSDVLKPGGFLAFSSTYFKENESDFRRFQSELLIEVVRRFVQEERDFTGRERMYLRSCEDYREEIMNAGFDVVHFEIGDVEIDPESLPDFYRDGDVVDFIAPELYPEEINNFIIVPLLEMLNDFRREGKYALKNKWLYVVAQKRL